MTYVTKIILKDIVADVSKTLERNKETELPWEIYMCVSASNSHNNRNRYGSHRFSRVLQQHGVCADGSLNYRDVLGDPHPIYGVDNKNEVRLWFLLFLLESGLH